MLYSLWKLLDSISFYWRTAEISVKRAITYSLIIAAISYLTGTYIGPLEKRNFQDQLSLAKKESRAFAKEVARANSYLNNLRAQESLNKKTIDLLNKEIITLKSKNLKKDTEVEFYRQILGNKSLIGSLRVHALDASPNFGPDEWQLSAILVRLEKEKSFVGSYYFEFIEEQDGKETVIRFPTEGNIDFEFDFYLELEQTVHLQSSENTISDLRIVILDKNHKIVVSSHFSSN